MKRSYLVSATLLVLTAVGANHLLAARPTLSSVENQIVKYVDDHHQEAVSRLETAVNINSGTNNFAGVSAVADLYEPRLQKMGFTTWREDMKSVKRGVHLFASHKGKAGAPRLLLIAHLDTIFEMDSGFLTYKDLGNGTAAGPGVGDMKGGNEVLLHTLEALNASGALNDMNVTVAFSGDEETPGADADGTYTSTRATLISLGQQADYVLAFEPITVKLDTIKTYRRGSSTWFLTADAKGGHSSLIFGKGNGPGAIYPVSKIMGRFYSDLRTDPSLTFNIGHFAGGALVERDTAYSAKVSGKDNVIPVRSEVYGDIRFLNAQILKDTRDKMKELVADELAKINAEYDAPAQAKADITFGDRYPAMEETAGNLALLGLLSTVSSDLGFGPLVRFTGNAGAADVSFVSPSVKGAIDGLGPFTSGIHSKDEVVDLNSIKLAAKRTAVLMLRMQTGTFARR